MLFFIIGISGVGKSTHGKKLSKLIDYSFIDLDALIEMRNGMRISEIFKYGENVFRVAETKALKSIDIKSKHVVATGGGVVETPENIEYMKKNGVTILLKRPLNEVYEGMTFSHRPLLKNNPKFFWDIYERRKLLYESAADLVFEVDTGYFDLDLMACELKKIIEKYDNSEV